MNFDNFTRNQAIESAINSMLIFMFLFTLYFSFTTDSDSDNILGLNLWQWFAVATGGYLFLQNLTVLLFDKGKENLAMAVMALTLYSVCALLIYFFHENMSWPLILALSVFAGIGYVFSAMGFGKNNSAKTK